MTVPDFQSLFTPSGAVMFAAGFMARRAWCWLKNRHLDRVDPEGAPHRDAIKMVVFGWGIAMVGFIYVAVQTQVTHDVTVKQADSAHSLAVSVAWENYFGGQERCALTKWVAQGMAPPQNVFDLHTTDPRYQEWARGVNMTYLNRINDIGQQRAAVAAKPPKQLPPPFTCDT